MQVVAPDQLIPQAQVPIRCRSTDHRRGRHDRLIQSELMVAEPINNSVGIRGDTARDQPV